MPGYGNFVLVPHLNQCRAVFVDRTIVVKSGLDVRMTMRDGSILVGPIAALEVNPHLRCALCVRVGGQCRCLWLCDQAVLRGGV